MPSIRSPEGVPEKFAYLSSWFEALGFGLRHPIWRNLPGLIFRLPAAEPVDWAARLAPFFPHIDLRRLRLADVIRLPLQLCWLLLINSPQPLVRSGSRWDFHLSRVAARIGAACVTGIDRRWSAGSTISARKPARVDRILDTATGHRLWQRDGIRATAVMAGFGVALLAMSAPLDPAAQAVYSAIVLAALLLLSRGTGQAVTIAATCLSGAVSTRYFWWRASETLDLSRQIDLTWGLLLLLAEMLLWFVAVIGRFEAGERKEGLPATAGFGASLARMVWVTAPIAVLIFNIRIIGASAPLLALYALPHLLAIRLVSSIRAPKTSFSVRQGRNIAAAWALLGAAKGPAAPTLLAWFNLLAVGVGMVRLASGACEDAGICAVFLVWAGFNILLFAIAVSRDGAPDQKEQDMLPSQVLAAILAGHRVLLAALLAALRQRTARLRDELGWWLPRPPVVALRMLLAVVFAVLLAPANDVQAKPRDVGAATPAGRVATSDTKGSEQTRRVTLKELSGLNSLPLRTANGNASVFFGSRADELVTRMKLVLRYSHSPALLPNDSHIKIMLNDEVIGIAPIVRDAGGRSLMQEIDIDPRFIIERNQLRFQFIGHYAATCEDPLRSSLWADISGASELFTSFASLPLQNDLSLLPEPFFDRRDLKQLTVPVIFSGAPALPTLNAAGIVSSWFGKLAGDRGARFPAHLDVVPPGHGVVVATNSDRPGFLRGHPKVDGPTIEMITNPTDGESKLLLVLGRDGNDIADAAQSLVLGHAAMSGSRVTINSRRDEAPRAAYDAPKWVRSDRPTRLGELIDYPQQLQATGHAPRPLKVDLKIPPDIFSLGGKGVPMTLRYRYSPPVRAGDSLLTMVINDEMVQSFDLSPRTDGAALAARFLRPDDALLTEEQRLAIPAYKFQGQNSLQFGFAFARHQEGPCPDIPPDDTRRAMVDPDSTLDLSGFHHFVRMPNLNHFASVGFPFTKYADLSQTVIVVPDHPSIHEIEAAITLLGYFGRATGLPASRVRIAGPGEESLLANADLLVIGSALEQGVLKNWGPHLPATVSGSERHISQPARTMNFLYDWLGLKAGFLADADASIVSQEKFSGAGPLALIVGFQSPLTPGRSVVAVTATAPDQLWQAVTALANPDLVGQIHGAVSLVRGQRVESMRVGDTYFIGDLPWWVMVWMPFSAHPILLALLTIAAAVLIAMLVWRYRLRRGGGVS
jgi:hypothetical protein